MVSLYLCWYWIVRDSLSAREGAVKKGLNLAHPVFHFELSIGFTTHPSISPGGSGLRETNRAKGRHRLVIWLVGINLGRLLRYRQLVVILQQAVCSIV
jgi:hypothetical protein